MIGLTLDDLLKIEKAQSAADEILQPTKAISAVHVGLKWQRLHRGPLFDADLHGILLIHRDGDPDQPALFNGGSHILSTMSKSVVPWNGAGEVIGFRTDDSSMLHTKDSRQGGDSGIRLENGHGPEEWFSEEILIDVPLLPQEAAEVAFWVTLNQAAQRSRQDAHFGDVPGLTVEVCDAQGVEFSSYNLASEFYGYRILQLGSLLKQPGGLWLYEDIADPGNDSLYEVVEKYMN